MEAESSTTVAVDGAQIVYRRIGKQRVQTGIRLSLVDSRIPELVLPNNRGIGDSTDDGQPFDIAKLAADSARVIETLDVERPSVLGSSMGGSIAQALALTSSCCYQRIREESRRISLHLTCGPNSLTRPARLTSRRGVCCSCSFHGTWPNLSIANSATSWQRRARNYRLGS